MQIAGIAQLVERAPEEGEVPGSNPGPSTFKSLL
ncbi:MAG: hypothetical protein Greene07147_72 [Parcubacteria group bacterium Greene0714_7]|nr:MAG: hypothetical protein Greene07147_72 [Parcubacteria group bacterium Greene0714_7]